MNISSYAYYEDIKEWGILKSFKTLSLNASYRNPVMNLNDRKKLVPLRYGLNYEFTSANALPSF